MIQNSTRFKEWFGDSKAIDAQGAPLVLYHGTKAIFDRFDCWPIYFTPDTDVACAYAEHGFYPGEGGTPNVMPVFAKVLNPIVLSSEEFEGIVGPIDDRDWGCLDNYADSAERSGHDGLHIVGAIDFIGVEEKVSLQNPYDQWVIFSPKQIKSVYNRGTFDPEDEDITK